MTDAIERAGTITKLYSAWSDTYDLDNQPGSLLDVLFGEELVVRSLLRNAPPLTILDAGCGTGRWVKNFAKLNHKIIAVDNCSPMIEKAKQALIHRKVEFILADIGNDLRFNNDFDLVICSFCLCHLKNIKYIFVLFFNYLKEDSILVVTDRHPSYRNGAQAIEINGELHPFPILHKSIDTYEDACASAGFRDIACAAIPAFDRATLRDVGFILVAQKGEGYHMANMGTGNGVRQEIGRLTSDVREVLRKLEAMVSDKNKIDKLKDILKDIEENEGE